MRTLIILSILVFGSFSFADECPDLTGTFSCNYKNGSEEMTLKYSGNTYLYNGALKIIADGVKRIFPNDPFYESITVFCKNETLIVEFADPKTNLGDVYQVNWKLETGGISEKNYGYLINANGQREVFGNGDFFCTRK